MVRLTVPGGGPSACIHWPRVVVLTKLPEDERKLDFVPLEENERIVGCGSAVSITEGPDSTTMATAEALYISLKYGIVSLVQHGLIPQIKPKRYSLVTAIAFTK